MASLTKSTWTDLWCHNPGNITAPSPREKPFYLRMHSISIFVPYHQKSGNRQKAFVDHEQDGAEAMCKQQKETLIRNRIGTVQLYGALLRKNGISGQLL